jgi:hypothetical protein
MGILRTICSRLGPSRSCLLIFVSMVPTESEKLLLAPCPNTHREEQNYT